MSDEPLKLTDKQLDEMFNFYKTKYTSHIDVTLREFHDIIPKEIRNQHEPVMSQNVSDSEVEFAEILSERQSFELADNRISNWLTKLTSREKYEVAQIIQEIARDTLLKEVDSGEEFVRELLETHQKEMFNVLDPVIRRSLETTTSSYVINMIEEEVPADLPRERVTDVKNTSKQLLQDIINHDPKAKEYVRNLTQNRELKEQLFKDKEVDHALTGGQDIREVISEKTRQCLKEDNDLKNLRISLDESIDTFEKVDIKEDEWKKIKADYKGLMVKIAEQEVIKKELSKLKGGKSCNLM